MLIFINWLIYLADKLKAKYFFIMILNSELFLFLRLVSGVHGSPEHCSLCESLFVKDSTWEVFQLEGAMPYSCKLSLSLLKVIAHVVFKLHKFVLRSLTQNLYSSSYEWPICEPEQDLLKNGVNDLVAIFGCF